MAVYSGQACARRMASVVLMARLSLAAYCGSVAYPAFCKPVAKACAEWVCSRTLA